MTGAQLDLLDRYAELLVSYNEKVNLTAITSPEGIENRHFAGVLTPPGKWTADANAPETGGGVSWRASNARPCKSFSTV